MLIGIAWVGCGLLAAGWGYAKHKVEVVEFPAWTALQRVRKNREDRVFCIAFGLMFGPIALLVIGADTGIGQYGCRWRL